MITAKRFNALFGRITAGTGATPKWMIAVIKYEIAMAMMRTYPDTACYNKSQTFGLYH